MRVVLTLGLCVLSACHTSPRAAVNARAVAGDTLRGVVAIEGSEPATRVILVGANGRTELTSPSVRFFRLLGLDVQVSGRALGSGFSVSDYRVRAAHGLAALDGTLRTRDGRMYLSLTDGGERAIPQNGGLPPSLVGSRVWVVLSADGAIVEFGSLEATRGPSR